MQGPRARTLAIPSTKPAASSMYTSVNFHQDTSFLVVGERTNANGSKAFREAMLGGDWDGTVAMAVDQLKEGAHVLDVCVDYTGADGVGRHGAGRQPLRDLGDGPSHGRLDRGPGGADGARVARRAAHHQLGQPRRGRRSRNAARQLLVARPRARCRGGLHLHRHRRPG